MFTRAQKQEAYKKLSSEIQDFIMSNETSDIIDGYLESVGFSEEESLSTNGEILWAMLNLQTLSDTITNIAKISNKNEGDLLGLKNQLQSNIFDKIQENQSTTDENDVVREKSETDVKKTFKRERVSEEEISNLPQNKQKFILDGVWQERTDEVAKKYSLSDTQTENLIGNVLLVLTDREKPEDFLETIISELGISRLLAEQILEDLEVRVFEYAVKSMEKKESKTEVRDTMNEEKEVEQTKVEILPEVKPEILPELEPNILPAVEKGEVAHDVKPEPVQKPISVPRFTAEPINEIPKPPQQTPAPEKKYAVDPYREPLE